MFEGKLFTVWQWEQRLYDGSRATFELLSRPDTVLVLPVTTSGDVALIEEAQPGITPGLRAIGGRIERAETPTAAAHRELLEEAGLTARSLALLAAWQPTVKIDWAVYLFVAHGLAKNRSSSRDQGEAIRVRSVSRESLLSSELQHGLDDPELAHCLLRARSEEAERQRLLGFLDPEAPCFVEGSDESPASRS